MALAAQAKSMKTIPAQSLRAAPLATTSPRSLSKYPWRWSWVLSGALHAGAFGFIAVSLILAPLPIAPPSSQIQVDGRWGTLPPDADTNAMRSADSDERWSDVIQSSRDSRSLPDPSASELASFVQRRIEQSIEDGKRRDVQANEDKLSRLGRRLTEASNRESIDEVAKFLEGMTNTRKQAPSTDTIPSPFDVATAQIDRVRKEVDSEGKVRYIATLIDENGTTTELELDSVSGEQLYRTMKIIESNPLLERVYRKIVMGFLDQMLNNPTTK